MNNKKDRYKINKKGKNNGGVITFFQCIAPPCYKVLLSFYPKYDFNNLLREFCLNRLIAFSFI